MNGFINETLKTKLIKKPTPKCNKTEFKQLYDRICSNPDDVIAFFDAEETGKKTEIAKKIIDTMVLESNFPPTCDVLDYLATFEQSVRYSRSVKYKLRDHYIHMCYLYFLGLYLFFYYQEFNDKLHGVLTLMKQTNEISEESNFVKSFLSAWKYFVLYHDIAYPFEYLGNKNINYNDLENKEKSNVERMFLPDEIMESITKQLALKVMATIIAVHNVIEKKSSKSLYLLNYLKRNEDKFFDLDGILSFSETLKKIENDDITFLQYIEKGDDIKYFYTMFDRTDFITVFKRNSSIECIAYKKEIYILKDIKKYNFVRKLKQNKQMIYSDEIHLKYPQLEIEYYGINLKKKFDQFMRNNGVNPSLLERSSFAIKRAKRMKDVVRNCYFECYNMIRADISPKSVLPKLQSDIKKRIFNSIQQLIQVTVNDSTFVNGQSTFAKTYAEEYVQKLQEVVPDLDQRFCEKIGMQALADTMLESDRQSELQKIYDLIKTEISNVKEHNNRIQGDVWEEYNIINISDEIANSTILVNSYIEGSLQKATKSEGTILDILSSYHLAYSDYDHGIVAASLFLKYYSFYQDVVQKNTECELLRVGFNIPLMEDKDLQQKYTKEKYADDYLEIIKQIAYAILVHNLYPKCFSGVEGIKTNILVNPFAYFCMICDMLQNWGRPYNTNPIEEDNPLFLDSKKYNILVDDYINIIFSEDNPEIISERLKAFGKELDTYLPDASEMIRTNFDKNN